MNTTKQIPDYKDAVPVNNSASPTKSLGKTNERSTRTLRNGKIVNKLDEDETESICSLELMENKKSSLETRVTLLEENYQDMKFFMRAIRSDIDCLIDDVRNG